MPVSRYHNRPASFGNKEVCQQKECSARHCRLHKVGGCEGKARSLSRVNKVGEISCWLLLKSRKTAVKVNKFFKLIRAEKPPPIFSAENIL